MDITEETFSVNRSKSIRFEPIKINIPLFYIEQTLNQIQTHCSVLAELFKSNVKY